MPTPVMWIDLWVRVTSRWEKISYTRWYDCDVYMFPTAEAYPIYRSHIFVRKWWVPAVRWVYVSPN